MTGPSAIRSWPPTSAITGTTRGCPISPRPRARTSAGPWTASRPGSRRSTPAGCRPSTRWTRACWPTRWRSGFFELDELRERSWNPQLANPGRAIHLLLLRDFAPLPERLASVAGRLAEVPAVLAAARTRLERMPKVHVETAIGQFSGTISLVTTEIDAALEAEPGCAAQIEAVRPAALHALTEHRAWLLAKLEQPGEEFADPRIGPERFARKLSLTLDAEADAEAILARAQADLDRVSEEIAGLAAELGGREAGRQARGPAGARPAGRRRGRGRHHPGSVPSRARRADPLRHRMPAGQHAR